MLPAVLDTNILVSALLRPEGPPGQVMADVGRGRLLPVFSADVMAEYRSVLTRPRLRLNAGAVDAALATIDLLGLRLAPSQLPTRPPPGLPDPSDWSFMACALAAGCPVITGNLKHFPADCGVRVMTAREWVEGSGAG